MSGHKIIKGLEEAVAFARGEDTGARVSQHPTPPSGWNEAVEAAAKVAETFHCAQCGVDAAQAIRSLTRLDSPSGWQLVPIEPTNRMKAAGAAHSIVCDLVYRDMLKHAPLPEPPSPREGESDG